MVLRETKAQRDSRKNSSRRAELCNEPNPQLGAVDTLPIKSKDQRSRYPMELHVESAGVADGLSLGISAPERGCRRVAVGTREADATGSRLRENAEGENTSALHCCPRQHLISQRARSSTPQVFLSSCLSYSSAFSSSCLAALHNTDAFFLPLLPFSFCSKLPFHCLLPASAAQTSPLSLGHLRWCQRHHLNRAPDLQQV